MPELALIELGSNIEPERNFPLAIGELLKLGDLVAVSHIYRTEPFGPPDQPDFVNGAAAITTDLSPIDLRHALRTIETKLGRTRTENKFAPRPIDLDLCLYGDQTGEIDGHTLPDPDILKRPYLAMTLAQVAPTVYLPGTDRTLQDIADDLQPAAVGEALPAIERAVEAVIHTPGEMDPRD